MTIIKRSKNLFITESHEGVLAIAQIWLTKVHTNGVSLGVTLISLTEAHADEFFEQF